MKDTLSKVWGIESEVVRPTIDVLAVSNPLRRGDKILFFSPLDYKGVGTAIEIARAMPEEQFMFVGYGKARTINQLSTVKNIEYLPWVPDPAPVYERAKLLIVPSLIPEGYGRVCVEAMARGIPCVVSGVGALPSTVGLGGDVIENHTSVKAWVSALSKYRDEGYLKEKSRMALEEARRRSEEDDISRVFAIVDRVAQRKAPH